MKFNFKALNQNLSYQWTSILVAKANHKIDLEQFDKLDTCLSELQKFNDRMIAENKGIETVDFQ